MDRAARTVRRNRTSPYFSPYRLVSHRQSEDRRCIYGGYYDPASRRRRLVSSVGVPAKCGRSEGGQRRGIGLHSVGRAAGSGLSGSVGSGYGGGSSTPLSTRIETQSETHSSQMFTPGPDIRHLT